MTFYIDLIFLVCSMVNFFILRYCTAFLSIKISKLKFALGIVLSGLLSLQKIILGTNYIFIIAETFLILRVVYGRCSFPEMTRRFFVLFGVLLVFGAVMNIFSVTQKAVFFDGGRIYSVFTFLSFFVGILVSCLILSVFLFFIKHRKVLYNVEIQVDDEIIKTTALYDSGNRLVENESRRPVIIIEESMLKQEHEKKPIKLKTVGNSDEQMYIVRVRNLRMTEENKSFENLYAGIAEHELSKNGEFHALLHSELK